MISFDDVRINETSTWFFIPGALHGLVANELKKSNIPYKSHNWRNIPKELEPQKQYYIKKFEEAGCIDTLCMNAIETPAAPDDLFQKTLLFFGDTIDPDYKAKEVYFANLRKADTEQAIKDVRDN